jgi:molybdate/tungstate transport system ATP-binding protein
LIARGKDLTLKIDDVSIRLGEFTLKDVNLEIGDSEYFVLLGPTGAGKTVLLDSIMGFHDPDKGRILLNGRDVTDVPTEKRGIGYVPQNCPLFPHMTVLENVEFGLKMQGKACADRRESVQGMLKLMELEKIAERTPATLSGGERQKVVVARVFVTEPELVLLDEPLASIDAEAGRTLKEELKRVNRELGVAIVHVTHDQIEAFSLGDRVAIMREGEIVQRGRPTDVLANPADESVARFLGYENVFHVELRELDKDKSEAAAQGISFKVPNKLGLAKATIAVRPEEIKITTEALQVTEECNILEGNVKGYVDLGPIVEVTVDAGLVMKAFVDKTSFLEKDLAVGKFVYVRFRVDSVKVLTAR